MPDLGVFRRSCDLLALDSSSRFPLISDWLTISNLGVPCPCLPLGSVPTCICCLLFHNATFPLLFPYVGAKAPERAHRKLNAKQCPRHLWKSRQSLFLFRWLSYLLHPHCSEISQQSVSVSDVIPQNADSLACRHCPNCLCGNGHFSASSLPRALVGYVAGFLDHFLNFQSLFSCLSFLFLAISLVDFPIPPIESFFLNSKS